ncbi:flavodoxin [Candidatus Micrarchaeota archaeon]|nr:flavodoxin [Candidatus Micrarchaeota archaeon]
MRRIDLVVGGQLQKSRVKVFYFSKSGNTKKVAEAIADEMSTEALEAEAVGTGYDMRKCDLLFVGSGNYLSGPAKEMVEFIEGLLPAEDRNAAVFGTSGGSGKKYLEKMEELLEKKGIRILGKWDCPGQEFSLKNRGRPNEEDLSGARDFAKKMLKKIEIL